MSIRGSLAAATVLASALALSGCSDDSSATESSETPASPTASASPDLPDDAMSTEPARPKDKKTPESAVEFGRHVVESVWYANQQGDASSLMALDDDESCTNCASIQDSIEETAAKGHRQLLASDVEITGATLLDRSTDTWVAGIAFTRPKLTEYDEAGKSVGSVGPEDLFMEIGMQWRGGHWEIFNLRYAEN